MARTVAPPSPDVTEPPARVAPRAAVRPQHASLPAWLLAIVFAFAALGVVACVIWGVGYVRGKRDSAANKENAPATVPRGTAPANPFQKYVEVSGVRFVEDAKKKVMVKFMITNHAEAELQGLSGVVTIWGRTAKSEEDSEGTFSFSTSLAAGESKELTAPLTTNLRVYELPDWQNATPEVQITTPAPASADSPSPR